MPARDEPVTHAPTDRRTFLELAYEAIEPV